ncbi:hypothetical protein VPH35_030330 [Triticum aestivum]
MLTFTELSCPAGGGGGGEDAPRSVDSQLWLACAGSMCTVPPVGAAVYYFPQGHAEQAAGAVDLSAARVPAFLPCRVSAVRFMADPHSDEVFAKIRLVPLRQGDPAVDVGDAAAEGRAQDDRPKPASFAKTLTQSDANNGGGFSVPRFCAETIFPPLDYSSEPPVQNIFVKDVHGDEFKFRHIYRGTPRRHLLTTGWSNFVNQKKLLAGDSIVFLRSEGGDVHVGIRRAKRKPRIPSYADFPFEGQLFHPPPPPFPPNHHHHHQQDQLLHHSFPFFPFPDSNGAPLAGIQGARHAQFGPSFSDLHLSNLQSSLLYAGGVRRPAADHVAPRAPRTISTDLTIGTSPAREDDNITTRAPTKKKAGDVVKPAPTLLLFGQAILTEEQMKSSSAGGEAATSPVAGGCGSPNWDAEKAPNLSEGSGSGSGVIQGSPSNNNTSSWRLQWFGDSSGQAAPELGLEPGQCKVFVESDAVGRNLDLSALGSFEELYSRMSEMFGMECAELRNHVLYRSAAGEVKHIGDEPFSAFVKSARRLTILTDAGSDNIGG